MAYSQKNTKGVLYILNSQQVVLKGGRKQTIYYFSKDKRPTACDLPSGKVVAENPRNGFLVIKNAK